MNGESRHRTFSWRMHLCRLLAFVTLGLGIGAAYAGNAQPANLFADRRVLLLHTYSEGFGTYEQVVDGFFEGIVEAGGRIEDLYSEKLDLVRFGSEAYKRSLVDLLRVKYADKKIDLIVTIQKPALDFALLEGRALFAGVPIISIFAPQIEFRADLPSRVAHLPY